MKYCQNCNLSYPDNAQNCGKCGSPLMYIPQQNQQPQQQMMAPSTDHTREFDPHDISQNKVLAMIPYLMGWIGIIISLLAVSASPYASFHVKQALKIQVVTILSTFLCIIPILGWIACGIISIIMVVVNLICFFSVCNGYAKEPPIVSGIGIFK